MRPRSLNQALDRGGTVVWKKGSAFAVALLVIMGLLLSPPSAAAQEGTDWITYEGSGGPGEGTHVVMIAGDQEYRSEEVLPMLGKILAEHHGFTCTVLFTVNEEGEVDPEYTSNVPGLEQLDEADLMVMFSRFLSLPEDQMEHIVRYTESSKPIVGIRTATHPFMYEEGPYAKYSWRSEVEGWEGGYGEHVFGESWYAHLGEKSQSTRGLLSGLNEDHPILEGVSAMWGPSDVYHMDEIRGDETALVFGQQQNGTTRASAEPDLTLPIVPIAWTRTYTSQATGNSSRVFYTSWGLGEDFQDESVRRLVVNGVYWALGMEDEIPGASDVTFVDPFDPAPRGVGNHKTGLTPADFAIGN